MPRIKIRERDIQEQILQYLRLKQIFHWRQNSGRAVFVRRGKHQMVRFGIPGIPDIIAVIQGKFIGIEIKGPRGVLSPHQKAFKSRLEEAGGIFVVARAVEDVVGALEGLKQQV